MDPSAKSTTNRPGMERYLSSLALVAAAVLSLPSLFGGFFADDIPMVLRLEGPDPEVVEEIRTLALRHGILTEYTSYLVLEPGMDPRSPQPLP